MTVLCVLMVIFPVFLSAADQNLTVHSFSRTELILKWQLDELDISLISDNTGNFHYVDFSQSKMTSDPGKPQIPYKEFYIAVPPGAQVSVSVTENKRKYYSDVRPLPAGAQGRDRFGLSVYDLKADPYNYNFLPAVLTEVSEVQYFRDLPIVRVRFYPVSFDDRRRVVELIQSAALQIHFGNGSTGGAGQLNRSAGDYIYRQKVINYEQGRQWLRTTQRVLRKAADIPSGPWFRMEILQDGIYRINRNALIQAGIDVTSLDPRSLRIFGHGGNPLPIQTGAVPLEDLGPQENAVLVVGEEDGRFDENDYILFFGSGPGGWSFDSGANDFIYTEQPYDKRNFYWLSYGGAPGKRMQITEIPAAAASVNETWFTERVRVEEDKYNLLASGTDWYGNRFFGLNGSYTQTTVLDPLPGASIPARFKIKFKSGNGIRWLDPLKYEYLFTVFINPDRVASPVFINSRLSSRVSRTFETAVITSDYLITGNNTFKVDYKGNYQECNAYLDWIELYYPRALTAKNNLLLFYTNTLGGVANYSINGFTGGDVRILDITDPKNVALISHEGDVQNGILNFKLNLSDNRHRRLAAMTTSSAGINNISALQQVTPQANLLDPLNSADLLVITHPAFTGYADEIVKLRGQGEQPLAGKTISTDDIYFWFSSGVHDPVAIRDFIRYAYHQWADPKPFYVLLFGDGHYDYRNIAVTDTNWIPPYEISFDYEIDSRETDNFYVDVDFNSTGFSYIVPDLAIGRLPVESEIDAIRMVDKLKRYENERSRDGWQTVLTFVGDDEVTSLSSSEWIHQRQAEQLATLPQLNKFIKRKIYLSAFNSTPGGFGRVKPEANKAIIDQLNEGTLLINYVGHGSPKEWAHENVLNMSRDLNRIQNEGKLTFWVAATCDFGKYDDPEDPSFTEALIWVENRGAIGVLSSSRLVYSNENYEINRDFFIQLFPNGEASRRLGEAMLDATGFGANDQKYHLFADPTMYLADPRKSIRIARVQPDTLKALSKVSVDGLIVENREGEQSMTFAGGAVLIVNDARYDSVNTGGPDYYTQIGPRIFKGEVTVDRGQFNGSFIVPKSIRYFDKPSGRLTVFAWDENTRQDAIGYADDLLFNGTAENLTDAAGPDIEIYFKDQNQFNIGDLVPANPVIIAELEDENGINLTGEVGHTIEIKVDDAQPVNITSFFAYDRDSYVSGKLNYNLEDLNPGEHNLSLQAWDNLNNPTRVEISFRIAEEGGLVLENVVNYPNPFAGETNFTFQTQGISPNAEVRIKIYTVSGRMIRMLEDLMRPQPGFNHYYWDGRDDDGELLANGVYLYKIILRDGSQQREVIEKLVILN